MALQNTEPKCQAAAERCGIQSYWSFAGQGLADHPWATYFGNPSLYVVNQAQPFRFQPKEGGGWGYLCPVLEEGKGNILEVCYEEWRMAPSELEWKYEHVEECKKPTSGFAHNLDKLVVPLPVTAEFYNNSGERIEELGENVNISVETALSAHGLEEIVERVNKPFKAKSSTSEPGRAEEPELGYGCGISAASAPAEWSLIGVSNGIEAWKAGIVETTLSPGNVYTSFEPLAPAVASEATTGTTQHETAVNGTINPYGYETRYVVKYGEDGTGEHVTPEVTVNGTGTSAVPVRAVLTGLRPGTTYYYKIVAKHPNPEFPGSTNGEELAFTTVPTQCSGVNVEAQGSPLQTLAQLTWSPDFSKSHAADACSGSQGAGGKPTVTYRSTTSVLGLESWGANGYSKTSFGPKNAFIGTEQPPTAKQEEEIESHHDTGESGKVLTIPVAQIALAIPIHLPANCVATSTSAPGRLVLSNLTLEKIFRGEVTKWSEVVEEDPSDTISGTGCVPATTITRVVSKEGSGGAAILKRYLSLVYAKAVDGKLTWNELAAPLENTEWPNEGAAIVRGEGDAGVLSKVAETPSAIGYADLAGARANGGFSPPKGGPSKSMFWPEIQDGGGGKKNAPLTYSDPSSNGDAEAKAQANCDEESYTNGAGKFPPPSASSTWSEVTTSTSAPRYTLCGLTYDVAVTPYGAFPGTTIEEEATAASYLSFVVSAESEAGQSLIDENVFDPAEGGTDYRSAPTAKSGDENVQRIAEEGVAEIAF